MTMKRRTKIPKQIANKLVNTSVTLTISTMINLTVLLITQRVLLINKINHNVIQKTTNLPVLIISTKTNSPKHLPLELKLRQKILNIK